MLVTLLPSNHAQWLDFLAMELDVSAIFFADPQLALKLGGAGKKKIDAV